MQSRSRMAHIVLALIGLGIVTGKVDVNMPGLLPSLVQLVELTATRKDR